MGGGLVFAWLNRTFHKKENEYYLTIVCWKIVSWTFILLNFVAYQNVCHLYEYLKLICTKK